MARIRTVKPEIWTDEDFIELSPHARLLLIALLNFASDYGVLPDKPKTLKMQCLPADDVDAEALIEECVSAHFLLRESAPDGTKVLVIRTFKDHQVINKKSKGRWGDPDLWAGSADATGGLPEDSHTEGKGREGKGTSFTDASSSSLNNFSFTEPDALHSEAVDKATGKPIVTDISALDRTFPSIDEATA